MSEEKKDFVDDVDVIVTNPLGVRPTYSNSVGASATLTDVRLYFNLIGATPLGPQNEIQAAVILPLPVMNGLIQTLQQVQKNMQEQLKNLVEQQAAEKQA